MKSLFTAIIAFCSVAASAAEKSGLPAAYTDRKIEGWNVRIDNRLLSGDAASIGEQALKVLNAKLVNITLLVAEEPLAKLRAVTIEMDLD